MSGQVLVIEKDKGSVSAVRVAKSRRHGCGQQVLVIRESQIGSELLSAYAAIRRAFDDAGQKLPGADNR